MLVLAAVGLAALGIMIYRARSENVRLTQQIKDAEARRAKEKLDAEQAAANERLTLARNQQEAVLAHARKATNLLGGLLQAVSQLAAQAEALKTNEAGQKVALHPDLTAQARRLYETDLPALAPAGEITTKLESVRRIEQTVLDNFGKAYQPEVEFTVTAQNAALWAEPEQRKVAQAQSGVASLVREASAKITSATVSADAPTLAAAIRRLTDAEANERQRILTAKSAEATTNAMFMDAQAEAKRILEEAQLRTNKVFQALRTQAVEEARLESLRQASNQVAQADTDAKLKLLEDQMRQVREETIAQSNRMWTEMEAQAEKHRSELDLIRASNQVDTARVKVATQSAEEEALKVQLRKKASSPAVQGKLAAFITPGYVQVNNKITVEKKPLSFTQLQNAGALVPGSRGSLLKLVRIANDIDDKIRPRWKIPVIFFDKSPEAIEKANEAQALLIELGPVLIEKGLLQP